MNSATLLTIKIGVDPVIVDTMGVEITWHGLFTAIGVIVGVALAAWIARKMDYPEDMIYNVALALVIGGIVGARLLFVIENWGDFKNDLGEIVAINTGGISIYGALIGGTLGGLIYAWIAKVPNIPRGLDIGALGGIIGMAIGRIGDIMNGEHFAKTTDLPWGVVYTDPQSPSYLRYGAFALPQHPAVAYELIGDLVIFAALIFVFTRVARPGVTFAAFMLLYGVLRFTVSFLRLDDEVFLGLRTAQLIAVGAMAGGAAWLIYLLRTPTAQDRAYRERRVIREAAPGTPETPSEEPSAG